MADRVVHAGEQLAVDLRAITANNACYATHLNLMMKSKPEDAETTGYERLALRLSYTHDFLIVLALILADASIHVQNRSRCGRLITREDANSCP